ELLRHEDSITGQCLRARKKFPGRGQRRPVQSAAGVSPAEKRRDKNVGRQDAGSTFWLTLHNAAANNLKGLTVRFPLNRLVVVTGVSGSGKSTLVREFLLPALEGALKRRRSSRSGPFTNHESRITGYESLKAVYEVEQ